MYAKSNINAITSNIYAKKDYILYIYAKGNINAKKQH